MKLALALLPVCLTAGGVFRSQGFLKWPSSAHIGALSSVAVAKNGDIYVLHRGEPPLLAFDSKGNYLRGFGTGLFRVAHGLRIDRDSNIWTTDNGNHVVRQFSPDGKLLLTLGQVDVPGAGKNHFHSPDDVVIDSQGNLFIADSGNRRVVKLSPGGGYLTEWGGEFNTAHGLAIDAADRIYVADRGNNRVQVFSPHGKLLSIWTGFGNPYGLLWDGEQLLVSEGERGKIFHLDSRGRVVAIWGGPEALQLPHFMALDGSGRLYVAEVGGKRVQIFARQR